jgi:hypothetical protein
MTDGVTVMSLPASPLQKIGMTIDWLSQIVFKAKIVTLIQKVV